MKFFKEIFSKKIVKVSFWSGINTLLKVFTGFFLSKFLAITVGPSGIAMVSQLSNFTSIFNSLSTGAVHTGVTKYVAEYIDLEKERIEIIKTGFFITFVGSIMCSLVLFLGANLFNNLLFDGLDFIYVFYVYALTILFYGINTLLLSVINGYKEFKLFILLNSAISLSGLILSVALVLIANLYGALLSIVLSQSISFIITYLSIRKRKWFSFYYFITTPHIIWTKKLMTFALMAVVSAFVLPITQIIIRNLIIDNQSLNTAGIWDGLSKISGFLQLFVITSLTTYYMPRLSEIKNIDTLKNEVYSTFRLVFPILVLVTFLIYTFRYYVVLILYTDEFLEITDLMKYQLLGDVFKLISWLFAYVTIAKGNFKYFLTLELSFFIYYIFSSYFLVIYYDLEGAVWAYCISYFINLCVSIFLFLRFCRLQKIKNKK